MTSDPQDVSDLFGADLPVEGESGGRFAWRDGPFLQALRQGHWVVFDEVKLGWRTDKLDQIVNKWTNLGHSCSEYFSSSMYNILNNRNLRFSDLSINVNLVQFMANLIRLFHVSCFTQIVNVNERIRKVVESIDIQLYFIDVRK